MPSNIAIDVRGLSKTYPSRLKPLQQVLSLLLKRPCKQAGAFSALKPMSFQLFRGETLGIIGRNGAGKSTLLQLICGTLQATSGHVQVNGKIAALLELGAGFNPEFTGRENIYLSASVYGLSREQTRERLEQIIAFAQIGEHIDQPVKTYSSGMFVRLAFAVIAHVDADILVIDEALAVGDVYFTQKCMRFLQDFASHGTLLFVSHDTGSVNRLCQRALWIDRGEVRMLDTAKNVVDAYLGSFYEDQATAEDCTAAACSNDAPTVTPPVALAHNNFADAFGTGAGHVRACRLLNADGNDVLLQEQAGHYQLQVDVQAASHDIARPIVGFYIKDRLGQPVCGTNTLGLLVDWAVLPAGQLQRVTFSFALPLLATGDYTVTVSLAAGTQLEHVQHHWVHDILTFKAMADPHLTGIFTLQSIDCSLD